MNVRNRLVNFRVTDEELQRLKTASALQQARCLSEFARTVVLESASGFGPGPQPNDGTADQLLSFDRRLARLEATVGRLVRAFESAEIFAHKAER